MSRRFAQLLRPKRFARDFAFSESGQSCQHVKRASSSFSALLSPIHQPYINQLGVSGDSVMTSSLRHGSNRLLSTTAAEPPKKPRKVTTLSIASKKRRGHKITMVTAYDYPSAVHVDRAGIDVVLVGDSCAMVELGFETTQVHVWCNVVLFLLGIESF